MLGHMIEKSTTNLASKINKSSVDEPVNATLETSERIIRRVTDGIYREPWAAFRELISNSYDADATLVRITTDWPRFDEIHIQDDGNGMSAEVLAYLIKNIGGSAKRTSDAADLGISKQKHTDTSPKGRKLIGKIGIGLFAVSHLTQHFQIITKRKGDTYRTIASILLETYSEDGKDQNAKKKKKAGEANIWNEPSSNKAQHGTTIIIRDIRPAILNSLRSSLRWRELDDMDEEVGLVNRDSFQRPVHHIGNLAKLELDNPGELEPDDYPPPSLPWNDETVEPLSRFNSFFNALADKEENKKRLDLMILDNYFQMLWKLSLSCPLHYINKHPFEVNGKDNYDIYKLKNTRREKAELIDLPKGKSVSQYCNLESQTEGSALDFRVLFDDIELRRPIDLPEQLSNPKSRIRAPLLFIGKHETPWDSEEQVRGGGPLRFEAYLYWNNGISPKENSGVLINVRGASGILFDSTFLNYQTSELNRLKQITAEIYVIEGLEAAMNADRESFNFSHPHYIFLRTWLHNAVRQLTSIHKDLGARSLRKERQESADAAEHKRLSMLNAIWEKTKGSDEDPYHFEFDSKGFLQTRINQCEILWPEGFTPANESDVENLVVILEAYNLLESLSPRLRGELLRDLLNIRG